TTIFNNVTGSQNALITRIQDGLIDMGATYLSSPISTDLSFSTRASGGNLSEGMRLTSAGRLGVGSTTPFATLSVTGVGASDPFVVASSTGTQLFRILTNGNVGVGTTTPSSKLSVGGDINFTGALTPNGNAGTTGQVLQSAGAGVAPTWVSTSTLLANDFQQNGNSFGALATLGTIDNNSLAFKTFNQERMRLDTNGNLGVGTSSPSQRLDVWGNFNVATSSTSLFIANTAVGKIGIGTSSPSQLVDIWGNLNIATSSTPLFSANTATGKIGIGTASPNITVDIASANVTTAGSVFGNLNVYTTNAQAADVGASITLGGYNDSPATALRVFGTIEARKEDATNGVTNSYLSFKNNTTGGLGEKIRITSAGSVGIGSSTPIATLAVKGYGGINPFIIASSTNTQLLTLLQNGNFGISTSTPGQTLTVAGTAVVMTPTNSSTAFQVQNSQGAPIFVVDTTSNNLLTNPGFEVNAAGWAITAGTGSTTRVTTNKYHGVSSLAVGDSATASSGAKTTLFTSALSSATQYTLSFYSQASGANFTIRAGIASDGVNEQTCTLNDTTVVTGGWKRFYCTFTSGTISGSPYIFIEQTDANGRTFYLDAVQLQTGAIATSYQIGSTQLRGVVNAPVSFQSTTNSVTALQIQGSTGNTNLFVADTLNGIINVGTSTGTSRLSIQGLAGANDLLDIASSTGTSALHISFNGNVGVGSSTPFATLAVTGIAGATNPFMVASSTNAQLLTLRPNGFFGVGSSTPFATLGVTGVGGANMSLLVASSSGAQQLY